MAASVQEPHAPVHVDKEKLKKNLDVSNFDPNAVLRGMQLTLVGGMFMFKLLLRRCLSADSSVVIAHRALQNPGLFTSQHYKQAAIAVAAGIVIRLLISFPVRFFTPQASVTLCSCIPTDHRDQGPVMDSVICLSP